MYENECFTTSSRLHASMQKSNVASYNEKKYWSDILNRNYLSTAHNEIKVSLLDQDIMAIFKKNTAAPSGCFQ